MSFCADTSSTSVHANAHAHTHVHTLASLRAHIAEASDRDAAAVARALAELSLNARSGNDSDIETDGAGAPVYTGAELAVLGAPAFFVRAPTGPEAAPSDAERAVLASYRTVSVVLVDGGEHAPTLTAVRAVLAFFAGARIDVFDLSDVRASYAAWSQEGEALLVALRAAAPQRVALPKYAATSLAPLAGVPTVCATGVNEHFVAPLRACAGTHVIGGAGEILAPCANPYREFGDSDATEELRRRPTAAAYRAENGSTLAHWAALRNFPEMFRALCALDPALAYARADNGDAPGHCVGANIVPAPIASDIGRPFRGIVRALVECGANLAAHGAPRARDIFGLPDGPGLSVAQHLVLVCGAPAVEELGPARVNLMREPLANGDTLLVRAINTDDWVCANALCAAGVLVLDAERLNDVAAHNMTLLGIVASTQPSAPVHEEAAMIFAVRLLMLGASPSRVDTSNYSAVGHALRRSNLAVAQQLMRACPRDWLCAAREGATCETLVDMLLSRPAPAPRDIGAARMVRMLSDTGVPVSACHAAAHTAALARLAAHERPTIDAPPPDVSTMSDAEKWQHISETCNRATHRAISYNATF